VSAENAENRDTHDAQAGRGAVGPERAFSIEEFCRRYGLGRTKVYEEIKLGRLRARKIGRRTIVTQDDAENWLQHLPPMKTINDRHEVVS
jgi:excisionase family DNA binding protein